MIDPVVLALVSFPAVLLLLIYWAWKVDRKEVERLKEIARCEAEVNRIHYEATKKPYPAWLVALGSNDWRVEKKLIEEETKR